MREYKIAAILGDGIGVDRGGSGNIGGAAAHEGTFSSRSSTFRGAWIITSTMATTYRSTDSNV
jgi:hypothetical protein